MARPAALARRWRTLGRGGGIAMTFALATPALVGAMSFGIDSALVQIGRTKLQNAADAAATAGARTLKVPANVAPMAIQLAKENVPVTNDPLLRENVLKAEDVVSGNWNGTTRVFTVAGTPSNAVRVTTRFAEANGNPHRLIFGKLIGLETADLSATATAIARDKCVISTTTALVSTSLPTSTRVVTQGQNCLPGSGWAPNLACYFATPNRNPIIRIDSAYAGAAVVTFKLANPARNFSFSAPYRGSFWVALTDFTPANNGTTTMVFNTFRSTPTVAFGGGTATYVSRFNVTPSLPGTPICEGGSGGVTASLVS
jgi:Flp pilus assembly protein TadG